MKYLIESISPKSNKSGREKTGGHYTPRGIGYISAVLDHVPCKIGINYRDGICHHNGGDYLKPINCVHTLNINEIHKMSIAEGF